MLKTNNNWLEGDSDQERNQEIGSDCYANCDVGLQFSSGTSSAEEDTHNGSLGCTRSDRSQRKRKTDLQTSFPFKRDPELGNLSIEEKYSAVIHHQDLLLLVLLIRTYWMSGWLVSWPTNVWRMFSLANRIRLLSAEIWFSLAMRTSLCYSCTVAAKVIRLANLLLRRVLLSLLISGDGEIRGLLFLPYG